MKPAPPSSSLDPAADPSTVYGPVLSWRIGWSLGIDLIQDISACSFDCVYCQLGRIRRHTTERCVYVPVQRVLGDLAGVDWAKVDAVTVSGCGEPCLAANLGEALRAIRSVSAKRIIVLTNSFHLRDGAVRRDLAEADEVVAKLDAGSSAMLRRFNRPAADVTIEEIVEGIQIFRKEFRGRLAVQTMLTPGNLKEAPLIAEWIASIQPDEVQLNTPKRFYPLVWRQENRGRHRSEPPDYPHRRLKTISAAQMESAAAMMRRVTGVKDVLICGAAHTAPAPSVEDQRV